MLMPADYLDLKPLNLRQFHGTGTLCTRTGTYRFHSYQDGTTWPPPDPDELEIFLRRGQLFPPIESTNRNCSWLEL